MFFSPIPTSGVCLSAIYAAGSPRFSCASLLQHQTVMLSYREFSFHLESDPYLRQASLVTANDCITDAIETLPIFPHYSFDPETLYGAVDGQKFGIERPTVKARHSRKYFSRGKGMVAYTLLCNHIPINGYLIGTNDYEAHHVFDI